MIPRIDGCFPCVSQIVVSPTTIDDGLHAGACPLSLFTRTEDGSRVTHSYSLQDDLRGLLFISNSRLCFSRKPDFKEYGAE